MLGRDAPERDAERRAGLAGLTATTQARVALIAATLKGNLERDSPDRQVTVYLPPGQAKSPQRRDSVARAGIRLTSEVLPFFSARLSGM